MRDRGSVTMFVLPPFAGLRVVEKIPVHQRY